MRQLGILGVWVSRRTVHAVGLANGQIRREAETQSYGSPEIAELPTSPASVVDCAAERGSGLQNRRETAELPNQAIGSVVFV